ncbi:UNVERIFIED_CONTAM: hypothetical protein RMT77_007979 [Armadillidium vulgare]
MINSVPNSENESSSFHASKLFPRKKSTIESIKSRSIKPGKKFPPTLNCYVKLMKIDEKPNSRKWMKCLNCTVVYKGKKSFTHHLCARHMLKFNLSLSNKENKVSFKSISKKASKTKENKPSSSVCNDSIFTCSDCDKAFVGELKYEDHYQTCHSLRKNTMSSCSHCSEKFTDKEKLFWHLQMIHYPLRTFKCSECEIVASSRDDLLHHIEEKHVNVKLFPCWACDRFYVSDEELIDHFENSHFKM